jgi:hypothetical protein
MDLVIRLGRFRTDPIFPSGPDGRKAGSVAAGRAKQFSERREVQLPAFSSRGPCL